MRPAAILRHRSGRPPPGCRCYGFFMTGTWRDTELSGACRYRLVRRLGAGGMGEVYLATQEGPGGFSREVVLKRMLPHLADDSAGREMFLDEARLTARLDHPSIVKI